MNVRRSISAPLSLLCVLAGCALWAVAPAQAGIVHVFGGSFGSAGSGSGQFITPIGVAVNDGTHDVYVVDRDNNRVEEFNETGSTLLGEFNGSAARTGGFSEPTQIAVDNSGNPGIDPSAGDVYVVDKGHGVVDKFSPSGTYEGQLTGTPSGAFNFSVYGGGVAVDPSGVVWVVQSSSGEIDSFSDALSNQYLSKRTTEFGTGLREDLAAYSENNIFIDWSYIAEVNSAGGTLSNPFGSAEKASGVAIDPIERKVYVDYERKIGAFSLSGEQIEPPFGSGHLTASAGVAVDTGNGTVYATEKGDQVEIFDAVHLPTVVVGALSVQQPRSVTLNGTVDPEGKAVTSCEFEYVAASEYEPGAADPYAKGESVPCEPGGLGEGTAAVPVKAEIKGLTPETAYHYRLVADNAFGSEPSPDQQFTAGPILGGEFVTDVASASATLQAPIDPNGADTRYYFEYGTTTAYGADAPALPPGADIGSAVGAQAIGLHLQDLAPSTLYHYRLVVVQGGEAFTEPDRAFTTQAAGGNGVELADGRTWEMVSPPEKKGALIEPLEQPDSIQAADDGSAITYLTEGSSVGGNPRGNISWSQALSRRGPSGWSTEDLTLPMALPENGEPATELTTVTAEYRLFSSDLSLAAVEPQGFGTPLLAEGISERTLYLRDDANGNFLPLVTPSNVPLGTQIEEPSFAGSVSKFWEMHFLTGTPDLKHVVFKTPLALTPNAVDTENVKTNVEKNRKQKTIEAEPQWNLYEWGNGKLGLVNVLPDGKVTSGPAPPTVTLAGESADGEGDAQGGAQRVVSSDGRRIAWTWGEPGNYKGLYVRDMIEEETVKVGGPKAEYQTMSGDGSRVFFIENGDLYECNYETRTQTDLTADHGVGESSAGVQPAVSDVSEDGSYVYFLANGVLAEGARPGACREETVPAGATCSLYLSHYNGSEWEKPKLIAALSQEDEPSWFALAHVSGNVHLSHVSSRVSPDGRYLTFMSNRSLTGYDNTDAVSGQPDEEVYLYDAPTGHLSCVSCNPTGARPVGVLDSSGALLVDRQNAWTTSGGTGGDTNHWLAGSIPGWDESFATASYQPRYLSNSGRLFFDSPDALVPQDTNGLEDAYEYEPPGVGSCTTASVTFSERSGGCVSLISSGTSSSESVFLDASESGDDAFFVTGAQLSSADNDTGFDIYDAHVCSAAVPCNTAPVFSPPCTSGDSCKAAPSPQPEIFGSPPSATFNGAGNITPTPRPAVKPKAKGKPSTRAQKLARALRACRAKSRKRRGSCEKRARGRYGPVKKRKAR